MEKLIGRSQLLNSIISSFFEKNGMSTGNVSIRAKPFSTPITKLTNTIAGRDSKCAHIKHRTTCSDSPISRMDFEFMPVRTMPISG